MRSRTNKIGIEYFDDLTGLYNRRYLTKKTFEYIQKAGMDKTTLSVVVIDLDHFKNINDTYGHSTGDNVLVEYAAFLKDLLRQEDTVYRYGGDEFVCILPDTSYEQAVRISSRFLEQCHSKEFSKIRLTCSIGIASFPVDGQDWLSVFNAADRRLYSAKRHGRDRIGAFMKEYRRIITPTKKIIGRDKEITRIRNSIDQKSSNRSRTTCICGKIGVGKTRLVHEIVNDSCYQDFTYLASNLSATTKSIPYYAFREIIRSVYRKKGKGIIDGMSQAFQIELTKIVPELSDELVEMDENIFMLDRFRLFEGVRRFLELQISESSLFVCIDNIHWADDSSLELLNYLVRALKESPVFFFFIYRIEEAKAESFQNVIQSMAREGLYDLIELEPLEQADVARMISLIVDASPSPELIAFIYRETGGNPFFIEELMKSLELNSALIWEHDSVTFDKEEKIIIPNSVRGVVDRKLGMIGHEARELIEYASVIGRKFDFRLLPLITGKNEGHLLAILDEILSIGLLREFDEDRYRFTEDVVRETIYQQMSAVRSKLYHRTVGNALEILHKNRTEEVIEELVHHFYLCFDNDKVVEYGMIAADRVKDSYANQDAIKFYGRVLECLPDSRIGSKINEIEVLMKRASVLDLVGDKEKAIEDLTQAISKSQSLGEKKLEADSLVALCKVHFGVSHYTDTIEMAENALEIYRTLVDKKGEAACLNCIGIANWYLGEFESALKLYQISLSIAKNIEDRQLEAMILGNISIIHWNLDEYSISLDSYTRALEITRELGDVETEARALNNIGLIYATIGDNEKAMECYERSLEISRDIGARELEASTLNNTGIINVRLGEYAVAIGNYEDSLNITREIGTRKVEAMALNNIGALYCDLGNYASALEYCTNSLGISRKISDRQTETESLVGLGDISLNKGELSDAEEYYSEALLIAQTIKLKSLLAEVLIGLTSLHLEMKNPIKAAETLNTVFQLVNELDSEKIEASAHFLAGRLATVDKRWNDAIVSFDRSLLILKKSNRQISIGEIYYFQGLMFRKNGNKVNAHNSFAKAQEIFEKIAAIGWIDKINAECKQHDI